MAKFSNLKYVIGIIIFVLACKKTDEFGTSGNFIGFIVPANFPQPTYNFNHNKVTKAGFDLGRDLFYDGKISRDNTISCGSCHIQSSAFTQHGHDVSHGIDDRLGTRNSPPIMNLAWSTAFMWGGGIYDLDLQPIGPITAHEEMDESLENVIAKLKADVNYPAKFKAAFGDPEITTARLMKALSQFMLMCVSSNTKYDKVMREEDGIQFTSLELEGYQIFKAKCSSCHTEPLFTDGTFKNNGLAPSAINDFGLYTATLQNNDKYKFKVPSLRNLKYTAPYMHDGRFLNLEAVFDHYQNEVMASPTLATPLKNGISLNANERIKILAFLNTLNDEHFITNPLLAEPN